MGKDYLFPKEVFDQARYLWGNPSDEVDAGAALWFVDVEPSGEFETIFNFAEIDTSRSTSILLCAALSVRRIRNDAGFEMSSSVMSILSAVHALRETNPAESVLLELDEIEHMEPGYL